MIDIDELTRELATQAAFLKDREPVYERMLARFAQAIRGEFGIRLGGLWKDRTFHSSYGRPLLLLASVRYDALCEGSTHPLCAALCADPAVAGAVTDEAFASALSPARTRLSRALAERAVQTNETSRAVAWLWPACLLSALGERRPVALVDLGCSAGLNLVADGLPSLWVDEHGAPIPLDPRPPTALRLGLDIAPLDVRQTDDAMWLRACVWPSDRARRARLDEAIELFTASAGVNAPVLEACPLAGAPARVMSLPDDLFVLCVQTVVRDYLGPDERKRYDAGMREFLLRRRPRSALVAELEVDPASLDDSERSATLVLRFAAGDGEVRELLIARSHPHPRQLFTNAEALSAFRAAFGPAGA